MERFYSFMYVLFCIGTAMVGMEIHHNAFYAVADFFFAPLAWIYWLITHNVCLTDIINAFSFFIQ